jgi:hypothetical protein
MWNNEVYMPLFCGAENNINNNERKNIQQDNEGENISSKNKNYSELTGLYWAWKNLRNIDYTGLVHYRRYFDFSKKTPFKRSITAITADVFKKMPISMPDTYKIFKKYDIVLAAKHIIKKSVKENFSNNWVSVVDFEILENVIKKYSPEYMPAYKNYINSNEDSCYNMFLAKREFLDGYCKWLFDILFEVEKIINIQHYSPYYARVFGFMGEFLLPVYVLHNKMKTYYCPVVFVGDEKNQNLLIYWMFRMRNIIMHKIKNILK